ncbi:MAG: hypothetical protein JXX28_12740 [Deltaproteobacteria bacterium]|nr:hypothetical protein [Deltaproteobacteria bacterium]
MLHSTLFGLLLSLSASAAPLRYAEDRAPSNLNPLFTTTMSEARLNELVFEGLFTDDTELRSVPLLAETASASEDKRTLTVDLRRGVVWHDEAPFTARDVVFTVEAYLNPTTASSEAGRLDFIDAVKAEGDYTVVFKFKRPEWAPEDKLHFKILPAHLFDGTTAVSRSHPFRTRPVGTGPWEVTHFNDDNSVSLQQFTGYYGKSQLPEVTMREVADKNYQAKLLIYESLETLVQVLPRDLAALQNDRKVELYPYQTNSWWYMGFNEGQERFQDPQLRAAVGELLDVGRLLAPIGTGDLLTGPFVKSSPFYNHDVPAQAHNPAHARSLLEAAGYELVGRQWMKDGAPLTVRLAAVENLETAQDVVLQVQAQLQSEGIAVQTEFLGNAEWKQRIWRDRDFDLILSQWTFDRNEDIYEQFHSKGSRNFVSYANPAVDALLDQARQAQDPQQKKAILREVHAAVAADAPMVFLWTLDNYSAMSTRVQNVIVHPFYFFTWARDWQNAP